VKVRDFVWDKRPELPERLTQNWRTAEEQQRFLRQQKIRRKQIAKFVRRQLKEGKS
jgi:hypothetical protein